MTYFAFLAGFVFVPILMVALLSWTLQRRGRELPASLRAWPALPVLGGHLLLAVLYTAPWDNYLVATRVWWYDPALVSGLVIGYVPIEEYLFFAAQTVLVGLWTLLAARLAPAEDRPFRPRPALRLWSTALAALIWVYGVYLLATRRIGGVYLGLELVWAFLPIALQFGFGADILWHYRRHIAWTLIPAAGYLCLADAFAIHSGTWTISPEQSFGIAIGGILPIEESIFFLLTTALVVFGMTLMLARPSHGRTVRPFSSVIHR